MNNLEIRDALIARDPEVTKQFYFVSCQRLFRSIIRSVFKYEVDYDEFINEFYLYLMENDAARLKQFAGASSIYYWMKVVSIRYFIDKRKLMIEDTTKEPLIERAANTDGVNCEKRMIAKVDVTRLLKMMPNRRYAYVIQRLVIQDAEPAVVAKELCTNVANLYNIKKRAMNSLMEIALNEIG
jgi:hypothetical protein